MAPTSEDFNIRTYELIEQMHEFDLIRADRCISGFGLEARVPFLDHRFIKTYLSIDPTLRMPKHIISDGRDKYLEKYLLRKAAEKSNVLPNTIVFRPKEAFSDGVSSCENSWFKIITNYYNSVYSDEQFITLKDKYTYIQPYTKEMLYYRIMFDEYYSDNVCKVVSCLWLPKWGGQTDPSARLLDVYYNTSVVDDLDKLKIDTENIKLKVKKHTFTIDRENISQYY